MAWNGAGLFWLQRGTDGVYRLMRSDVDGAAAQLVIPIRSGSQFYVPFGGNRDGICLVEDGGAPSFISWSGARTTFAGTGFIFRFSNANHCVWTASSAGKTTVVVFDVDQPSMATQITVNDTTMSAVVVVNDTLFFVDSSTRRLFAGALSASRFSTPRLPAVSTFFDGLVASDDRVFTLSSGGLYEVFP